MRRIAWARHTKIKRWVITTSNHWWIILTLSHLYSYLEKLIKWAKIEIGTKIEATKIELKLRRAYPQNLRKWIEIERLLNLRKHGCADRRFCVRSRPVRLTHLDRLSFNMFLTHFCFRQLSPLVRDLKITRATLSNNYRWISSIFRAQRTQTCSYDGRSQQGV